MFKLTRTTNRFYSFILIACIIATGIGIWHFWKKGPANIENITMIFEASTNLEKLKNNDDIKYINLQVGNDRSREAVKTLIRLERDVKKLDFLAESQDNRTSISSDLKHTKVALDKMITLPSLSSILNVLYSRVQSFEGFVVGNNWRTLTRVSRRMIAELKPVRLRKPGVLTQSKISSLVRTISRDLSLMEKVTTGSILSKSDKELILARISTLKTEVVMLKKYLKGLKSFKKAFQALRPHISLGLKLLSQKFLSS